MSGHTASFLEKSTEKAADDVHRRKLIKATDTYFRSLEKMKASQWSDWQQARNQATLVKNHVLAHLPDLLEEFETRITARGAQVLWAADKAEAQALFMAIVERRQAKMVVKGKSMTTEEIGMNELLEEHGIKAVESDLGEMIVQTAGEKPYHIVTPAMHMTREEIGRLFHNKLGAPLTDNAEELTMFARAQLRQTYLTADIGVSGANYLIADEGAVCITENEGNARLSVSCPPVHVVIAGIEKVLPRLEDLTLFWPMLATAGTGQQVTCYNSIIRGPRQPGEADGPEEMIVILLDNGRSEMYQDEHFREALRCIRCGACLNACPVFRTIGGHSYETTYQGPIGAVITPQLKGVDEWQHLSFASSLCGACTSVCPVKIPLHELLLENRSQADQLHSGDAKWRQIMRGYALAMGSRSRLNMARGMFKFGKPFFLLPLPFEQRHKVPDLAPKSFADMADEIPGLDVV